MSCGNSIFPIDLIYFLQEIDFFTLNHVKDPLTIDVWKQGWRPAQTLELEGD